MKFIESKITGVHLISIEKIEDNRGFFARTWDDEEFKNRNLESDFVQSSISFNKKKGTIRGLHFQLSPYEETKIISCISGKVFDVIVDLRKNSPTYKKWESNVLDSKNHDMLYVPKGIAHGFQTIEDNSKIYYKMSEYYRPEHYSGIRYDDPNLKINWPLDVSSISENDKNWNFKF